MPETYIPAMTITYGISPCSLGELLVASTGRGICAIELGDDIDELVAHLARRRPGSTLVRDDDADLLRAAAAVVDGRDTTLDRALDIEGTEYQRKVWQRLAAIPAGRTMTYLELATAMGDPGALRAVAGACAANPLAVVIPCHRVLRADGALGGYRWGIERKRALLVREGALDALTLFDAG